MQNLRSILLAVIIVAIFFCFCSDKNKQQTATPAYGAFSFEHKLTLPVRPEIIYDAITGDISGWWDHSFSGSPKKF